MDIMSGLRTDMNMTISIFISGYVTLAQTGILPGE